MRAIKAMARQTVFDIAMQEHGSAEAAFEILKNNPALDGITIDLPAGTILMIDDASENTNASIRDYLASEKIATGTPDTIDPLTISRQYSDEYDETQYS